MFIASSIGGLNQSQPSEQWFAGSISAFQSVGYHLERLTGRRNHVNRELVEEALHPQQRRDVSFVIDTTRHVEEVTEPFAGHLVRGVAGPAQQRFVYSLDTAVRLQRDVAAGCILEHILEIIDSELVHRKAQTNDRMAEITSSGALRLGQCPVASKIMISLFGIPRWTNSPTSF